FIGQKSYGRWIAGKKGSESPEASTWQRAVGGCFFDFFIRGKRPAVGSVEEGDRMAQNQPRGILPLALHYSGATIFF
ncbi:hypothetical protein ACQ1Z1_14190, partial [Enterococcus faecalis]|uniref:hypothetical protein n=1 Tax=Enterococcus faecalis TaxID=1351 RepID=UPI003D6AC228